MPSKVRNPSRVKTPAPSTYMRDYGFNPINPYSLRRKATRNRTINYREPDSDSDDDVIYVGQRTVTRTQPTVASPTPTSTIPIVTLGEEDPSNTLSRSPMIKDISEINVAIEEQHQIENIVEGNGRGILETLPYEIHQNIAGFLEHDSDIRTYAQLCKQTRDSISSSVWRKRFCETFDMPEGHFETLALAQKYAYRRQVAGWICFDLKAYSYGRIFEQDLAAQEVHTKKCLLVLRDLIIESNARKIVDTEGNQSLVGLNHEYIRNWVQDCGGKYTDIIDAVLSTTKTSWHFDDVVSAAANDSLVLVIQLCLTYVSLRPDSCNKCVSHFDMSQKEAYVDHGKQPVFVGGWKQDINVRWLLHTVNFFKLHLKSVNGVGVLAQHYDDLERHQIPQPWLGRIQEGTQPLGSHWKSAYTFLKDLKTLKSLRLSEYDDEPAVDDGEMLSDMTIFFDDDKFSSHSWPMPFETLLKSDPYSNSSPPRARRSRNASTAPNKKYELKAFYGTSRGPKGAHFYGRIHGLPSQQGVPGFQRVSMVKFYPNEGEYDPTQVWAYEGCVLPGGRIIVGRWWDLTASPSRPIDIFGGPFIWWNVDDSMAEPPITSEEALDFLDSIHDASIGFA